jgi:hypothetical protein
MVVKTLFEILLLLRESGMPWRRWTVATGE